MCPCLRVGDCWQNGSFGCMSTIGWRCVTQPCCSGGMRTDDVGVDCIEVNELGQKGNCVSSV